MRPIQEGEVNALLEAERDAEATKQAIKRKIAQSASVDFQNRTLPAKLKIEADDPEDVVCNFCSYKCISDSETEKGKFSNPYLFSAVVYLSKIDYWSIVLRKQPSAKR